MTPPTKATLARYGLSADDWRAMYDKQGGVCAICKQYSKRLCVDHEHVKRWKALPASLRKNFVRGLLCWTCNHYSVGRRVTVQRAKAALAYLEAYEVERKSYIV